MYPFYFKVKYSSEVDNADMTETGLGLAENYSEAMKIIENRYGNDIIAVERLELLETDTLITLPEEVCKNYVTAHRDYNSYAVKVREWGDY